MAEHHRGLFTDGASGKKTPSQRIREEGHE